MQAHHEVQRQVVKRIAADLVTEAFTRLLGNYDMAALGRQSPGRSPVLSLWYSLCVLLYVVANRPRVEGTP